MNLEHFANILKQQTLQEEDINNLKQIINKYPYFQSARALYLKGLKNTKDFNYDDILNTTAAYTTDRNILYDYITSSVFLQNEASKFIKQNKFHLNTLKVEVEDISVDKSVIIDEALRKEIKNSKPVLDPALFQPRQASNKKDIKSFQISIFSNNAIIIESNLDRDFTIALKELIQNKTNLEFVTTQADLIYEGEIIEYATTPITKEGTDAQNKLTIDVKMSFYNKKNEEDNFDQIFSFSYDFSDDGPNKKTKTTALNETIKRVSQDIFNASLAK